MWDGGRSEGESGKGLKLVGIKEKKEGEKEEMYPLFTSTCVYFLKFPIIR